MSVIVPVHNRERLLREAVESLLATRYPALEILIVDDGSTDGSVQVAEELVGELPETVRLLAHANRANRGAAASRDLGITHATGDYVCFLDSDDYVFPNRFATAVALLDGRPDIDGVFEPTRRVVESGGEERSSTVRSLIDFDCDDPDRVLETILTTQRNWSVNAITLRRQTLQRVGGFGQGYTAGPEDLFLWLKLASTARLTRGATEPVAAYRIHGSNMSSGTDRGALTGPLFVYLDVLRWLGKPHVLLENAAKEKMYYVVSHLRGERARGAALRVLFASAKTVPSLWRERRFWSNLVRAVTGS